MIQFEDIYQVMKRKAKTGHCLSLPIPIMKDGIILDAFLAFTVDRRTGNPRKPMGLYLADMNALSVDFVVEDFDGVRFEPAPFKMPDDYKDKLSKAHSLYGKVREEVASGHLSNAALEYSALVRNVSQASLLPFYEMLSPGVFSTSNSNGEEV
jgi:hypothetical protein